MSEVNRRKARFCSLAEIYSPYRLPQIDMIDYMETHKCRGCGIRYKSASGIIKVFLRTWQGSPELSVECEEQEFYKTFQPSREILYLYGIVPESGTKKDIELIREHIAENLATRDELEKMINENRESFLKRVMCDEE